ncbi:oxygenase MpaB family protein [Aspergillus homomorphus CBS 101889]|uniref:ER-bound oxygenase mpaB/mpaB'/Rubber oxygenase catalytic domain-containing protein n=1 Tax=Aspergillus homomorphus (strain CBS 101889) TaxID=1450537 RepID=A0A395HMR0_ASPHC|nr:hypothetical protein BO97DRAFT_427700 [Aspergillus homomorphus CBS 101889]RAL09222.1 hypothetical protein BO97DRAFT_427700 [Aspergillus homomorphus CBS 101889]
MSEKTITEHISAVPSAASSSSSTTTTTTITNITNITTHIYSLSKLDILPQILSEGILLAGSGAALLLQAAYPGIKSTFPETSSSDSTTTLTHNLTTTLETTLTHISILICGSPHAKQTLLTNLHPPHPASTSPPAKQTNPNPKLWLPATIYTTATDLYQRIYGSLSPSSADSAYTEFGTVLHVLNHSAKDQWPASRLEFWRYWDKQVERLAVTGEAHRVAREVLYPPHQQQGQSALLQGGRVMRVVIRAVTVEMLPPGVREVYGLKSTGRTRALYRGVVRCVGGAVYPAMPGWVRGYPLRRVLGRNSGGWGVDA